MDRWADILVSGLEMLAILFAFDAFFPRRFQGRKFWAFVAVLFSIHYSVVQLFSTPISYKKIIILSLSFLCVNCVLYRGKWPLRILITVVSYALLYLLEFLGQFLSLSLLKIEYPNYIDNQLLYTSCGIVIVLVCVGIAYILKLFHKPTEAPRGHWLWGSLTLFFPILSLVLQLPLFYLVSTRQLRPIWAVISCVIMIAANVFIIWVLNLLEKNFQMHENALALSERVQVQMENIEALSAAYSSQRKMTHDFRQHLQTLSGMLQRGEVGEAQKYLFELQERQSERILLVNTHNAAMDAILNQKAYVAKQEGMDVHFEVNDLSRLKIKSIDFTVVIANLFDNAIEACRKLQSRERWITVKAIYDEAFVGEPAKLFLSIVNSSPSVSIINGQIQTTKENSTLHGFGIPNVKSILDRYDAFYIMQYENGEFQFSVEWPDK